MFKKRINRNDERYGQLAQLLEFMLIMNHADVHRDWLIMTTSGHRSEEASEITSAALRVNNLELASFTAPSSRAILMFLWIRLSFTHKAQALNSLFPNCHVQKLACFYELRFGRISPNMSFSFYIRDLKLRAKVSNSTCRPAYQFVG